MAVPSEISHREPRAERRLAAVLAADVVGYSRLMGRDEEGTLARLAALRRDLVDPKIAEHKGRIFKALGDGLLVEFPSAVEAVLCAAALQAAMAERNGALPPDQRLEFRIGINSGDVIVEDGDLLGDGVNIAARLEALAEPGGVCLSGEIHGQVEGKVPLGFVAMGEPTLKNIARQVKVFRIAPAGGEGPSRRAPALTPPDRPSIAVLPFQNMSGDPEQEYFADGMVEEIITALSRVKSFFVIARNSSFTYKGRAVDVKQVSGELGVRYVLEGSVRKSGNRVRISGQLIDAATGHHLWADRFEGALEDIFDLQDRVASSVVGAIEPRLWQAEVERAWRKPTANLDAYDYLLHAYGRIQAITAENIDEAIALTAKALELDPRCGQALALAAWCYFWRFVLGWSPELERDAEEGVRLAKAALDADRDDPSVLVWSGHVLSYLGRDREAAQVLIDRALALNPNASLAHGVSGWIELYASEPEAAIGCFEKALRLSPLDPMVAGTGKAGIAYALLLRHRPQEAIVWARQATEEFPRFLPARLGLVAALALTGRVEEAHSAGTDVLRVEPRFRVSAWQAKTHFKDPAFLDPLFAGLRKARLPE